MSWVAASGWDTNETCEAGTSTIVASARSAMNRWSAGGIALSWVPSRYQHGSVFQASGPDGAAATLAAHPATRSDPGHAYPMR
jgi:3-hydroxy-3-methylglutaryl CoA synthase